MAVEGIAADDAADIIATLIKKAVTKARYVFSFTNLVETLEEKKQELMATQSSIEDDAKRAQWRTEIIYTEVQKWLKDAENLKSEVDELQKKIHMHNTTPCFPNCIQRYLLGSKAEKKIKKLTQHISNCNFSKFSHLAPLQGMEYHSSESFASFKSRKWAHDQIKKALKDHGIHKIGVYGMGGCGKTTLVKEVGKEVENLGLFEKVLFVVVPNPPNVRKIQESIASLIGLRFELGVKEHERARRLSMTLCEQGRILVILDDLWEKLNFEVIGIPNNCRILLTTRNSSVCNTMECQEKILLSQLNEVESWNLFQKCAGITEDNFDSFKDVGQEIANECKGLPVAIAAVAGSLKGKELFHWEDTRDKLEDSEQVDIEPGIQNPYKCLQVSYDNLIREEFKSLFLLCSLFPEDFEIPVELLTRFAMGLGLFGKIHSNERTRNQVSVAINKLIDSCLLQNGDERNTIKMHDLVHDIALQIAKIKNKIIKGKKELGEHSILKDDQIRYLFLDMDEFPQQLHCPKLQSLIMFLYLQNEVVAPDDYFNRMEDLRVLALFCIDYKFPIHQLAKSMKSLTNLRCLMLVGWDLGDISFVGSLSTIEDLTLYYCSFDKLPDSVANLKHLRLLDLVKCKIESNPYGVIQRCSKLEELYFVNNEYRKREEEGEYNFEFFGKLERYRIDIGERFIFWKNGIVFCNLTNLKLSGLNWRNSLKTLFLGPAHLAGFEKLQKISISNCSQLKHLIASDAKKINSEGSNQRSYNLIFPQLEVISIAFCEELEYLMPVSFARGLLKLEKLEVRHAYQLKYVFCQSNYEAKDLCNQNPTELNMIKFQALEELALSYLPNIVSICPENYYPICPSLVSMILTYCPQLNIILDELEFKQLDQIIWKNGIVFYNLTKLELYWLDWLNSLETLFLGPTHHATFEKLEEISVSSCSKLKHLIASDAEKINSESGNLRSCNSIFPQLKKISIGNCKQLDYLMPVSFARGLLKLEYLNLRDASKLKYVFCQSNYEAEDQSHNQNLSELHIIRLQALKYLKFDSLTNIVSICPENYYPVCPFLVSMILAGCPQLNIILSEVEFKQLDQTIGKNGIVFCNLTKLEFVGLNSFETLFLGPAHVAGFEKLQEINIWSCSQLKHLIASDAEKINSEDSNLRSYNSIFPQLKVISIGNCEQLEYLMPVSFTRGLLKLEYLNLRDASKLKYVFCQSNYEAEDQSHNQNLSELHIIRLQALKYLKFDSLTNIVSICPENYYPVCPFLVSMILAGCPQLNIILGAVEFKQLDQTIGKNGIVFCNLTKLEFVGLNSFETLFLGPAHVAGFEKLQEINIWSCSQLKHLIASDTEKINSEDSNLRSYNSIFPQLKVISIGNCEQLEYLMPVSFARGLLKLQKLEIISASQLKYVFCPSIHKIIEENANKSVQKSLVLAKSEVKTSSIELVQNARKNEQPLMAEEQAHEENKVDELPNRTDVTSEPSNISVSRASPLNRLHDFTTSSQLPFSADVTSEVNSGDILSGFDLNKPPKEFFEVIEQRVQVINNLWMNGPMSGASLMDQQEALKQIEIHFQTSEETKRINKTVEASDREGTEETGIAPLSIDLETKSPLYARIKGSVEEVPTLGDAKMLSSTHSKATSSVPDILQGQIRVNQTKNYTSEDVKEDPINPEELKDVDLVSLLQSMEEDSNTQAPMLSFSKSAAKNLTREDNLVAKALADLQVSLKAPLKDIASTEAASLRLENALNFLSCHSFEDDAVSYGLKAAIDSLHQDFPSIISFFKQTSTTIDRFVILEEKEKSMQEELPRRKESAVTLIANISKTQMSMAEIQQKEASLMEQISRLQVELNDNERRKKECEAELSSLQQQKTKCVAEAIEFKKQFKSVKENKSQMIEDRRKAQEKLFMVNNKWSALCSQFEQNH